MTVAFGTLASKLRSSTHPKPSFQGVAPVLVVPEVQSR